jgi:ParB-like chromosome segregation protein Spo0J
VSPKSLNEHPSNPRIGDVESVKNSIRKNGFFGTIVVQESTNYVLAGNHRLKAVTQLGFDSIPATFVDVDDEQAMRILLADNRTSDLGTYDEEALTELLEHLASTDDGLDGTGYDESFLSDVDDDSDDDEALCDELDFKYIIEIELDDEQSQFELSEKLEEMNVEHSCRMI